MRQPIDPASEPYEVRASQAEAQRQQASQATQGTGLPTLPGFVQTPSQVLQGLAGNVVAQLPGLGNLAGQVVKLILSPRGVGMWIQAQSAPMAVAGALGTAAAPVLDLVAPWLFAIPYAGPTLSSLAAAGSAIGKVAGPLYGFLGSAGTTIGGAMAAAPDPIAALSAGTAAMGQLPPLPALGTAKPHWGCIFEGCQTHQGTPAPTTTGGAAASSGILSAMPPEALGGFLASILPTTAGASPSVPGVTEPIRRPTP